jgi:hypothetical protein
MARRSRACRPYGTRVLLRCLSPQSRAGRVSGVARLRNRAGASEILRRLGNRRSGRRGHTSETASSEQAQPQMQIPPDVLSFASRRY